MRLHLISRGMFFMIDRDIMNIYTKVLKEGWTVGNIRNVGGVYVVFLRCPDRSSCSTIWLVPPDYRAPDINYSVMQQGIFV
ncbi:hypothetical protein LCGC14_1647430 [marine sediment metagenome]|uniref:Uncharacterized protein n=1 Tax=marine sediment metagenome TaxID=412755 RepID=A0A0F9HYL4_9ZZZZ